MVPPAAVEPTAPLVDLIVSTESLCPCAGQWTHDLVNTVLPAVGEIVDVQRYVDGTANDDGSVWVFHGEAELAPGVCLQSCGGRVF